VLLAQGPLFGAALAFYGGETLRVRVYVDGFNLYYGALKGTPFKWLNLVALSEQVLPPGCTVDRVNYFTARVSGASKPGASHRQHAYLSALNTLPLVTVHFGSFLAKTAWRPLTNLPVADKRIDTPTPVELPAGNHPVSGSQILPVGSYPTDTRGKKKRRKRNRALPDALIAEVYTMEEKGSDVNLAAHLLNDAWRGLFDMATVISNDTDLITPIRLVTIERKKPVLVVCPGRWQMAPKLKNAATYGRHIHRAMLKAAQFPERIPGTTISKPEDW